MESLLFTEYPKLLCFHQDWGQLHKNDYNYDYDYTVIMQGDYNYNYKEKG